MARTAAPNRVGDIVGAALRVFGRRGFARAQMSEVAEAAGVSVGTLYNYVEGKDALLLLCAAYAFDPEAAIGGERPLTVGSRKTYLAKLRRHLDGLAHLPALDAALAANGAPKDVVAECTAIVADLFDLIARTRLGMDALERSARDVPDVAALFYGDVRLAFLRDLTEYIARRAKQRRIPSLLDPAITARFAVESVTWMARHRHGDPDGHLLDGDAVRASTIQLVTRAICGEDA
jgi:AcrR family transcriptional regulator